MNEPTSVLLLERDNTGRTHVIDHNIEYPADLIDAPDPDGEPATYEYAGTAGNADGTRTPKYQRA
jgi:hypothetical protein